MFARQRDESIDERGSDVPMYVNALDREAGLAGIEVRAVDEIGDGRLQRRICSNVGRILPAELQICADELPCRCSLHGAAAVDRSGERHEFDASVSDHCRDVIMTGLHILKHAIGKASVLERLGVALRDEWRLL